MAVDRHVAAAVLRLELVEVAVEQLLGAGVAGRGGLRRGEAVDLGGSLVGRRAGAAGGQRRRRREHQKLDDEHERGRATKRRQVATGRTRQRSTRRTRPPTNAAASSGPDAHVVASVPNRHRTNPPRRPMMTRCAHRRTRRPASPVAAPARAITAAGMKATARAKSTTSHRPAPRARKVSGARPKLSRIGRVTANPVSPHTSTAASNSARNPPRSLSKVASICGAGTASDPSCRGHATSLRPVWPRRSRWRRDRPRAAPKGGAILSRPARRLAPPPRGAAPRGLC